MIKYLDHIHVCWAAGDGVVHLPHLAVSLHGNQFDGHRYTPTSKYGGVHHLCVLWNESTKNFRDKFVLEFALALTNGM